MRNTVGLTIVTRAGRRDLPFSVRAVWNGGWAGRDQADVRRHIEELAEHGVPAPTTTPILFPLSNNLVTTADQIQVISGQTSGEVEFALLIGDDGEVYVTVASDHTDRAAERHGVQLSKQLYPNVLAPEVWPYSEVCGHWDRLVLRSWATIADERTPYQEATLASLLSADEWLAILDADGLRRPGLVFVSGTPPTVSGLLFADAFEMELEDPVLGRRIRHRYAVEVLPPGRQ